MRTDERVYDTGESPWTIAQRFRDAAGPGGAGSIVYVNGRGRTMDVGRSIARKATPKLVAMLRAHTRRGGRGSCPDCQPPKRSAS